jgi:hypothetical protein
MVCDALELEGASEGCALRPVNASQTPIVTESGVSRVWRVAEEKGSEEEASDGEVARWRCSSRVMMEWRGRRDAAVVPSDSQLFHVQRRKRAERSAARCLRLKGVWIGDACFQPHVAVRRQIS